MKRLLITGSTGFIGKSVTPILHTQYDIFTPTRDKLNLLDTESVRQYLKEGKFDVIIHLANPTAQNPVDERSKLFELSLRVFMSLLHNNDEFGKMIYIGSGAEYGKHRDISQISENEFGRELPLDPYGLSRYIMNQLAGLYDNIINLRVFGCYGYGDLQHKLIQHVISCISDNEPINLRQNTLFDFIYVKDIAPVLTHFIENTYMYKSYNLCSGEPVIIGDIADIIRREMNSELPITFEKDGYGLEYTGDNHRLRSEISEWKPHSLVEGIKEMLADMKGTNNVE